MAIIANYNPTDKKGVWMKDITFDESKTITFKVYKYDDTNWYSSTQELSSSSDITYYSWASNNNGDLTKEGSVTYYAYMYDGASTWTQQALTCDDHYTFTTTIDNQTAFNSNLQLIIAPSIAFSDDLRGNEVANWDLMYRPFDENQEVGFSNQNNYGGGCWKDNSNSLKLNAAAHYDLTFYPYGWTYSIDPYIERTLYPAVEGYSTFSSIYNVAIPSGIDASYVTGVEGNNLTTVAYSGNIKARDAALIHANLSGSDPVVYKFTPATVASENIPAASGNKLVAVYTEIASLEATDGNNTNYILTNNTVQGTKAVGFYKANSNRVAAGKAYLQLSTGSGARSFFPVWGDETTLIKGMEAEQHDGEIFNLNGQRVNKAVKGLYIVNGKKVMFK